MFSKMDSAELPDVGLLAELLKERHKLDTQTMVEIKASFDNDKRPELYLSIERAKRKFRPREMYSIKLGQNEPHVSWDPIVDALDALLGSLIESGYRYRELPSGEGVVHGEHSFDVFTDYYRPDIEEAANRMLNGS
jgi:hypothetical protein